MFWKKKEIEQCKIEANPVVAPLNLIRLPKEYRFKYSPTPLERRILSIVPLENIASFLFRENRLFAFSGTGTVSFTVMSIVEGKFWDKETDEIVFTLGEKERNINEKDLCRLKEQLNWEFTGLTISLRNIFQYIKDLKAIESILKDETLFM